MVVNGRPLKRMKRRVTADLYDFFTFPSAVTGAGAVAARPVPFRTNVRDFLSKHALVPPPSSLFPHLMVWQVLFRAGDLTDGPDSVVYLDIIEEDVARSRSVCCDQCRVVGELTRRVLFRLTDSLSSLMLHFFFSCLLRVLWAFTLPRARGRLGVIGLAPTWAVKGIVSPENIVHIKYRGIT